MEVNNNFIVGGRFVKNYNSMSYWEPFIRKNKTLRERIFRYEYITDKTIYLHYTIFTKKSGVESGWVPAPNLEAFLGYVQYCLLPEAYYKWIYGRKNTITKIPIVTAEAILNDAVRSNEVTEKEKRYIENDLDGIKKLWRFKREDCNQQVSLFCSKFNSNWIGDADSFLYMKAFFSSKELGEFIIRTVSETNYRECFKQESSMGKEQWLDFCEEASKDKQKGEELKQYLFKELKEII